MTALTSKMTQVLEPYRKETEKLIKETIANLGEQTKLRDACEYALLNGGKRFRPALVLLIANALEHKRDVSGAALAVEFFHTASLIADDLPCMDDDDERRNRPSLHKVYGEAMALLASYALIASGYELLAKNGKQVPNGEKICLLALENASYNTGLLGATGGQFLDISPPDLSLETVRKVIHRKTSALFEMSFVLGWLYGGGEITQLDRVKHAAGHFGMAFQIMDDLGDMEQDRKNGREINMGNIFGKEEAVKMFHEEHTQFLQAAKELNLNSQELYAIADLLKQAVT